MERLFISRQSRHSDFKVSIMLVLIPICTLTWRVYNFVSRQGEGINRRNESTKTEGLLLFWSADDTIQYYKFPSLQYWKL